MSRTSPSFSSAFCGADFGADFGAGCGAGGATAVPAAVDAADAAVDGGVVDGLAAHGSVTVGAEADGGAADDWALAEEGGGEDGGLDADAGASLERVRPGSEAAARRDCRGVAMGENSASRSARRPQRRGRVPRPRRGAPARRVPNLPCLAPCA
jgi:hypothetical protein